MQDPHTSDSHRSPTIILPCERRYRTHTYFLADQLRCSDALEDFRSVKALAEQLQVFSLTQVFQFQRKLVRAEVPIESDMPRRR